MHDIDRTQTESNYYQDFENYQYDEMESEGFEMVFDEATEMELTSDLLEVMDDSELDQFLGDLIRKVAPKVGRFMRSKTGRMLGGALKGMARKALPHIQGALKNVVPSGFGNVASRALGQAAGQYLGLELEGLSPDDQEFEVARHFVRFAGDAVKKAATLPPSTDPRKAVKIAIQEAASKHAPGILAGPPAVPVRTQAAGQMVSDGNSGRWVRRGNKIILYGA